MPEFKIFTLEIKDDGIQILSIHDSIGSFSDSEIFKELEQLLHLFDVSRSEDSSAKIVPGLVVDFAGVEYFGSSFLEAMRAIWNRIEENKGKMVLCNVCGVCLEILEVSKFDTIWPILDSRDEAIAALKESRQP